MQIKANMQRAKEAAKHSNCHKAKVGAAIYCKINKNIKGYGCNLTTCTECGRLNLPSGKGYELCKSVHAEVSAIMDTLADGYHDFKNSEIYIYGHFAPCRQCLNLIRQVGIKQIHCKHYDNAEIKSGTPEYWEGLLDTICRVDNLSGDAE